MEQSAGLDPEVRGLDLVVVDRAALRQLLAAVANALDASVKLDSLGEQEGLEPAQVAELRQQVLQAREELAQGVRRVIAQIDQLPRAQVGEEVEQDQQDGQ